jgi:hypothetical protein
MRITGRDKDAIFAIGKGLGDPSHGRAHGWEAACHRFEKCHRKAIMLRAALCQHAGKRKDCGPLQGESDLRGRRSTMEENDLVQTEGARTCCACGMQRAISEEVHTEACGTLPGSLAPRQQSHGLDQDLDSLLGHKPGHGQDLRRIRPIVAGTEALDVNAEVSDSHPRGRSGRSVNTGGCLDRDRAHECRLPGDAGKPRPRLLHVIGVGGKAKWQPREMRSGPGEPRWIGGKARVHVLPALAPGTAGEVCSESHETQGRSLRESAADEIRQSRPAPEAVVQRARSPCPAPGPRVGHLVPEGRSPAWSGPKRRGERHLDS